MRRLLVVLAAMALLAGCARTPAAPDVASAGSATGTPAATSDVVTAYVESVRAYVKCLRGKGIQVTDPNPRGRFEFEGDLRVLKADPRFTEAQRVCGPLLPPVPTELQDRPVRTPQEIATAQAYATCMRSHGAPDFPDPGCD